MNLGNKSLFLYMPLCPYVWLFNLHKQNTFDRDGRFPDRAGGTNPECRSWLQDFWPDFDPYIGLYPRTDSNSAAEGESGKLV